MKAYRGVDGKIRIFRPMENMNRMRNTAKRSALPVSSSIHVCLKSVVLKDGELAENSLISEIFVFTLQKGR
jgi:branched-chain amino acid aminotransferase